MDSVGMARGTPPTPTHTETANAVAMSAMKEDVKLGRGLVSGVQGRQGRLGDGEKVPGGEKCLC